MKMIHCCEQMERLSYVNDNAFENPDNLIYYNEVFDEYGMIIHDGGTSYILIHYCPWCGKKFRESKREQWFEQLEQLGYENPFEEEIPSIFESRKWWKNLGIK